MYYLLISVVDTAVAVSRGPLPHLTILRTPTSQYHTLIIIYYHICVERGHVNNVNYIQGDVYKTGHWTCIRLKRFCIIWCRNTVNMKVCTQYPYKFPFLKIKVQVDIIFKALYGLKKEHSITFTGLWPGVWGSLMYMLCMNLLLNLRTLRRLRLKDTYIWILNVSFMRALLKDAARRWVTVF